jgi:hypothetical protein
MKFLNTVYVISTTEIIIPRLNDHNIGQQISKSNLWPKLQQLIKDLEYLKVTDCKWIKFSSQPYKNGVCRSKYLQVSALNPLYIFCAVNPFQDTKRYLYLLFFSYLMFLSEMCSIKENYLPGLLRSFVIQILKLVRITLTVSGILQRVLS